MTAGNARRTIAAGVIGNVLEWYDFAVYGYFAAAIGRAFFPREDSVAQVLAAFGVFAIGFLMRPIGGAIIGHIGDRHGRRTALTVSVVAMAVPTFLVGVLPDYHVLGIAAPILLILLRMVQGLSVGGEYTTSLVFIIEHSRAERRGAPGPARSAVKPRGYEDFSFRAPCAIPRGEQEPVTQASAGTRIRAGLIVPSRRSAAPPASGRRARAVGQRDQATKPTATGAQPKEESHAVRS